MQASRLTCLGDELRFRALVAANETRRRTRAETDLCVDWSHMQQWRARRGTTCTLASALGWLRRRRGRRLVESPQPLRDARASESEPGPGARAEAYSAQFAGMLVDPGARLPVEPGNLNSIDERLDLSGYHASEPLNQSIGKQVGEAIERGIVVVGLGPVRPSPADHRTSSCAAHDKLLRSSLAHASPRTLPVSHRAATIPRRQARSARC
jgi:hypothetical protein